MAKNTARYVSSLPMATRVALFLAVFVVGVDTYIVAAILPLLEEDLGTPIAQLGFLATAYALPNAILAPAFGPLSDRFGRRSAMVSGAVVFVAAAFVTVVAPNFEILIIGRFANGIGAAILFPASLAYAADASTPEQRGEAMGQLLSAMPLSTVLGIPAGAVAASIFGWRGALGLVTVLAMVVVVFLWRLEPDERSTTPGRWSDSYRIVLRDRGALKALLVTFAWIAAPFGLLVYMAEFLVRSFDVARERAGLVYMVIGAVGLVAARVGSRYINRIGKKRSVMIGISLFTVAAFLLPLTAVFLPLALLNFGMWAFGSWFGIPAQQALVSEMASGATGTVLAFNSAAVFLGAAIGPPVIGALIDRGGFELAGPAAAVVGLVALSLAALLLEERERDVDGVQAG